MSCGLESNPHHPDHESDAQSSEPRRSTILYFYIAQPTDGCNSRITVRGSFSKFPISLYSVSDLIEPKRLIYVAIFVKAWSAYQIYELYTKTLLKLYISARK
ncbi:hypothetical protein ElyMa_002506100 [Elysia marginata]|uniref:Uncharacterized protein n=1 Tax=Elysia marginata TaxID=1093978 RepID=A0AAV4GSF0_9GAST|nr:hypothetical protein ElyMa_002506100 [Elysia marginata]